MAKTVYKDVSLLERLATFIEWRQDPQYWYTLDQLALALKCHRPSLHPTFSLLRQCGYSVSLKWVRSKKCYLYRFDFEELKALEARVAKAAK